MTGLTELLLAPERREQVVSALEETVIAQVNSTSGLSGVALRTALAAVRKLSPDLVRRAVAGMLPDIASQLEPFWAARGGQSFAAYLPTRSDEAADALLAVADERATRPSHAAVARIYGTVRPKAKAQVTGALPALGATIDELAASA